MIYNKKEDKKKNENVSQEMCTVSIIVGSKMRRITRGPFFPFLKLGSRAFQDK